MGSTCSLPSIQDGCGHQRWILWVMMYDLIFPFETQTVRSMATGI